MKERKLFMIQFCFISKDMSKLFKLQISLLKKITDEEDLNKYRTKSFTEQEQDITRVLSDGEMPYFSINPVKEINMQLGENTKLEGYVLVISYNFYITKINNIVQVIIDTDNDKIYIAEDDNVDMSQEAQINLDLMNKYLDFKKAYEKKIGNTDITKQTLFKLFGGMF